jgi:hypothetical protein
VCYTKQDAYQALNIKANMSTSNFWGSFKAKVEAIKDVQKHDTSLTILVLASQTSGVQTGNIFPDIKKQNMVK